MTTTSAPLTHECPAAGCHRRLPDVAIACEQHWGRLSRDTQDRLLAAWQAVQDAVQASRRGPLRLAPAPAAYSGQLVAYRRLRDAAIGEMDRGGVATSTCPSCQRPIVWAVTHTGSRMPVDRLPVADGTIQLVGGGDTVRAVVLPKPAASDQLSLIPDDDPAGPDLEYSGPRYRSHFATCPKADHHRKKTTR